MRLCVILACLTATAQVVSQPPAEMTTHDQTLTFKTAVNMVSVPVVVRDTNGRTVGNLTQQDFQLFDRGKLQTISKFTVEKAEAVEKAAVLAEPAHRLVDGDTPSNRQMDEIHRALAENLVIFFRDQHLSPEQHLDFGRKFGELHIHPAAPADAGHPELMVIHADKDSPRANGEGWHTDVSCDPEPPMGSILYIRKCPPAAATRCSPICTPPMRRCRTA